MPVIPYAKRSADGEEEEEDYHVKAFHHISHVCRSQRAVMSMIVRRPSRPPNRISRRALGWICRTVRLIYDTLFVLASNLTTLAGVSNVRISARWARLRGAAPRGPCMWATQLSSAPHTSTHLQWDAAINYGQHWRPNWFLGENMPSNITSKL